MFLFMGSVANIKYADVDYKQCFMCFVFSVSPTLQLTDRRTP